MIQALQMSLTEIYISFLNKADVLSHDSWPIKWNI